MSDLDTEILELKTEGKSLREIASVLGISHETVRKRLKNLADREQVLIKERNQELTASFENEKVSTGPNAHQSRAVEESESIVNLIPSVATPSHTPTEGVNFPQTPSDKPTEAKKGGFQGVDSEGCDLLGAIKDFLEAKGMEVYRMRVSGEAYQVRHNGQVIRFYVQRGASQVPRTGEGG